MRTSSSDARSSTTWTKPSQSPRSTPYPSPGHALRPGCSIPADHLGFPHADAGSEPGAVSFGLNPGKQPECRLKAFLVCHNSATVPPLHSDLRSSTDITHRAVEFASTEYTVYTFYTPNRLSGRQKWTPKIGQSDKCRLGLGCQLDSIIVQTVGRAPIE